MKMFTVTYRQHGNIYNFPVYAENTESAKVLMERIESDIIILKVEESKDLV